MAAPWYRSPVTSVYAEPAKEPVTTDEAKLFLRVDTTADDDLILSMIHAARMWCETYTGRSFITQTIDQSFAGLPTEVQPLLLKRGPVASITSVTYLDADGVSHTLPSTEYALRKSTGVRASRFELEATSTTSAPTLYGYTDRPVTVRTVCGYGVNQTDVPQGIKAAVYLLVGDQYEARQTMLDGSKTKSALTVEMLLAPYRIREAV